MPLHRHQMLSLIQQCVADAYMVARETQSPRLQQFAAEQSRYERMFRGALDADGGGGPAQYATESE